MKTSFNIRLLISSALVHAAFSQSLNSVPQLKPSHLSQSQSLEESHSSQSLTLEVSPNNTEMENSKNIDDLDPKGIHWGNTGAWEAWAFHYQDRIPSNNDESNNTSNTGRITVGETGVNSGENNNNYNINIIEGNAGDVVIPNDDAVVHTRPGGLTTLHGSPLLPNDNNDALSGKFGSDFDQENYIGIIEGDSGDLVIPNDDFDVSTRPGGIPSPFPPTDLKPINDYHESCAMIEQAIGIGPEFGVKAHCECKGDFANNNMEINCAFDECAPGTENCGYVVQNFAFGDPNGLIETSVCTYFDEADLEETCINYNMDIREPQNVGVTTIGVNNNNNNNNNVGSISQTCEATYGGEQCKCTIENNNCLSVDCSAFLPGGKIDNYCQLLSMDGPEDTEHWIPNFDSFQSSVAQLETSSPIRGSASSSGSSQGSTVGVPSVAMATIGLLFGLLF